MPNDFPMILGWLSDDSGMTLGWLWDDSGMTLGLGKYYRVLRSSIFIQGGNYSRGGHYRLEKGFTII